MEEVRKRWIEGFLQFYPPFEIGLERTCTALYAWKNNYEHLFSSEVEVLLKESGCEYAKHDVDLRREDRRGNHPTIDVLGDYDVIGLNTTQKRIFIIECKHQVQFLRGVAYMAHLGELIAELRQDKGLTQKELGDILCVSSGTISNYENGVHLPDVDKVIALANYFHVTTDYLLGRTSSNLPVELLQQAITNEKTLGDVMASFAKLPANRQAALSLIISDMEVRQMIDTYSKTGDSK